VRAGHFRPEQRPLVHSDPDGEISAGTAVGASAMSLSECQRTAISPEGFAFCGDESSRRGPDLRGKNSIGKVLRRFRSKPTRRLHDSEQTFSNRILGCVGEDSAAMESDGHQEEAAVIWRVCPPEQSFPAGDFCLTFINIQMRIRMGRHLLCALL
jgi:hypothetical protein